MTKYLLVTAVNQMIYKNKKIDNWKKSKVFEEVLNEDQNTISVRRFVAKNN